MNRSIATLFILAGLFLLGANLASAQQKPLRSEEEQAKKMDEFIQGEVKKLESALNLEGWQVFYVDSIMNNDYAAMQAELMELNSSKVGNADLYIKTQDSWMEKMYLSFKKVFNETQWEKYQKMGAGREAKLREKRRLKSAGNK